MANTAESHSTHREVELLDTLRNFGGSARTASLAEALQVSEETVRRTVKALAKADLVQRVHGGVFLTNADARATILSRLGKHSTEKSMVASAAARLIPNGSSLFLDVGSTTAYVAEKLRSHHNLTIITNGIHAAQTLVGQNNNHVYLTGGELRRLESGTFGPEALAAIQGFNIDIAVLSVDAIDASTGFLLTSAAEADLARIVIGQAKRIIIVADHSKFGQTAPMVICRPNDIDFLVTDQPLKSSFQHCMTDWEIETVIAAKKG